MSQEDDVSFLYKTMIERDPKKRRVKPVESAHQSLLDFDMGESSDDSDFRIEDHCEESDDDSVDSNDNGKDEEDDDGDGDGDESDDSMRNPLIGSKQNHQSELKVSDVIQQAKEQASKGGVLDEKLAKMLICCGCLGDRSDDINEIVECDGCGVTVHEGCYGVSDVESFSSTDSLCQSAPWFCEACSAGIQDPSCELCPNKGGIFKETDVGKWVHLVCALYVPGVAFGEVDRLASVTLFEMAYNKWGSKSCSLCEDLRYSRTGVCIECDAGMCHTYFHVTCAQREGLLSEAHSEEVDQADPFYAHCKLHSDKALVRRRRRNWLALQIRSQYRQQLLKQPEHFDTDEQRRIQRKLAKHRHKYLAHKSSRALPWVPTQKMPRLLTTSASACRQLAKKAELMGIERVALEAQEAQLVALTDVRKKWHIPPAFSVEFIGYYLDRNLRVTSMKRKLQELLDTNAELINEQPKIDKKLDEAMHNKDEQIKINNNLKEKIEYYHKVLRKAGYIKPLPLVCDIARPSSIPTTIAPTTTTTTTVPIATTTTTTPIAKTPPTTTGQLSSGIGLAGVPTAAALKMGVGFPLPVTKGSQVGREGRVLSSQAQQQQHHSHSHHHHHHQQQHQHQQQQHHHHHHQNQTQNHHTNIVIKPELTLRHQCGICRRSTNQHLLAKCDTCQLHYHLSCLTPPLTRMPKKTKLMGWQCSECDKESSGSDVDNVDTSAPRKLRYCKDDNLIALTTNDHLTASPQLVTTTNNICENTNNTTKPSTPTTPIQTNTIIVNNTNNTNNIIDNINPTIQNTTPKLTIKPVNPNPTSPINNDVLLSTSSTTTTTTTTTTPIQEETTPTPTAAFSTNNISITPREGSPEYMVAPADGTESVSQKSAKKRRREKHKRYSPDPITGVKQRKRKHKRKSMDIENPDNPIQPEVHRRITIKIKPIPRPAGDDSSASCPQLFVASSTSIEIPPPSSSSSSSSSNNHVFPVPVAPSHINNSNNNNNNNNSSSSSSSSTSSTTSTTVQQIQNNPTIPLTNPRLSAGGNRKIKEAELLTQCNVCNLSGTLQNLVKCDECKKCYHFTCLEPPVKKSPKRRGYSWHCADCDPSASETEN